MFYDFPICNFSNIIVKNPYLDSPVPTKNEIDIIIFVNVFLSYVLGEYINFNLNKEDFFIHPTLSFCIMITLYLLVS